MPISAFAQKHRAARYLQNLMTPPRGPCPSATTPILMVGGRQLNIDARVNLFSLSEWGAIHALCGSYAGNILLLMNGIFFSYPGGCTWTCLTLSCNKGYFEMHLYMCMYT